MKENYTKTEFLTEFGNYLVASHDFEIGHSYGNRNLRGFEFDSNGSELNRSILLEEIQNFASLKGLETKINKNNALTLKINGDIYSVSAETGKNSHIYFMNNLEGSLGVFSTA